jgi:branched-chain amino acid transport system ATP-binding protein
MTAIVIDGLNVSRGGKKVVHDLSFTIARGAITTLLGANGAGKSTTVQTLAGVLPPDSGSIRLGDIRLDGRAPDKVRRLGIALVPEGHRVLGELTVDDNLVVACPKPSAWARKAGLDRVYGIFPELAERRRQRASVLSGGQKQMVAMGQALIAEPEFMIVDELSLGLAPTVVRRLAEVLKGVAAQGIGVLLIEQFATLALELAEHALVLERGRLVFDGAAETLKAEPDILHGAYL